MCEELLNVLSQVSASHIQLNAIVTFCCERHLRVSHVFSCLFRQLYINQCKIHMSCLIPRSSSTCTACITMHYRFFNVWNKLLKCTYVHLCLLHSKLVSNIQTKMICLDQELNSLQDFRFLFEVFTLHLGKTNIGPGSFAHICFQDLLVLLEIVGIRKQMIWFVAKC